MSYIYINEQGSEISVDGGYCVIDTPDKAHKKIPIETIEYVSLFGNIHITTPAIQMFMQNKIPVTLYSNRGAYFGSKQQCLQRRLIVKIILYISPYK